MTVIIGIDPGSRRTGFGVIDASGGQVRYVTSGIIRLPEGELPARLKVICQSVGELIDQYKPQLMAIEDVFFARDPRAALRLGQARGAAIVAGVQADLPVAEYSARTVKQAVVGNGAASKEQVQHMVTRLLSLPATPQEDAADALAVAICHAHSLSRHSVLNQAGSYARGRLQ
tara:strand:+ start:3535 stop:4053 length:519 start_codon:yes stop_codon:yes gene_type:complete